MQNESKAAFRSLLLASVLSGLLHGLAWRYDSTLWWISFVAWSPWALAMIRSVNLVSWSQVALSGVLYSVVSSVMGFSWISYASIQFGQVPLALSYLILFAYGLFGEPHLVLAGLLYFLKHRLEIEKKNSSNIRTASFLDGIFLIIVLTASDAVVPRIFQDTAGAPLIHWLSLGQLTELTGPWGLTFLVYLSSVAFVSCRKWLLPLASAFVLFLHFWGQTRLKEVDQSYRQITHSLSVGVVQANIGDLEKIDSERGLRSSQRKVKETYQRYSLELLKRAPSVSVLIWPETAYPYIYTHQMDAHAELTGNSDDLWISERLREFQRALIFGTYTPTNISEMIDRYKTGQMPLVSASSEHNSAVFLEASGVLSGVYNKTQLLPFGDYIPLGPFAGIVSRWIPAIGTFLRGSGPNMMTLAGVRWAPLICYEAIVPSYVRSYKDLFESQGGPQIFVNITNDSWFGNTSEPHSHLMLARLRAIEARLPFLRSTNTGISALISPTGEIMAQTSLFKPSVMISEVKIPESSAVLGLSWGYWNQGPWFLMGIYFLVLAFFARALVQWRQVRIATPR